MEYVWSPHLSLKAQCIFHAFPRYLLSNAVNDDGTYTDGGWYICEEEEKAVAAGVCWGGAREMVSFSKDQQDPLFDGRILQDLSD